MQSALTAYAICLNLKPPPTQTWLASSGIRTLVLAILWPECYPSKLCVYRKKLSDQKWNDQLSSCYQSRITFCLKKFGEKRKNVENVFKRLALIYVICVRSSKNLTQTRDLQLPPNSLLIFPSSCCDIWCPFPLSLLIFAQLCSNIIVKTFDGQT